MINPNIENAHTELCKAIDANFKTLGSEQYTLLINLADTLANKGDDLALKATVATSLFNFDETPLNITLHSNRD